MKLKASAVVMLFLMCGAVVCFAEDINVDSKITEVTVYPDSAIIKRIANLKLKTGEHKIIFSGIIPEVDQNSLTVSGKGTAEAKIFGAQIKKEFLEKSPSEEVKRLEAEIEKLDDRINGLNNKINILQEQRDFLDSIKMSASNQIPKDLLTKFPSAAELESLSQFLLKNLQENQGNQEAAKLQIRDLNEKKDVLRRQLIDISSGIMKLQRSIVVELEAIKPGDLDLVISYLVRGVSWTPVYDARASFEQGNAELVFYSLTKQATGEPWEDVDLLLSTAKPSIGGKMLELSPWYLRPYQPLRFQEERALRKGAAQRSYVGMQSTRTEYADVESMDMLSQEPSVTAEMVYAKAEEKGTAVVYNVRRKSTIKSDGTEHKVPILSQNLAARFEYAATPKLSNYAYLMSKVKNSKEGQLLPGRVNIFLEGDFVGTSSIPKAIGSEEEFDLYLGIDEGITVKRKKIQEKVDETLIAGISSRTKSISFEYKLIVENYKSQKIKVNLYDQIPVSENDQIAIKKVKFSEDPKMQNYLDRRGIMCWEFELEPRETKEITLSYTIEHPRDMQIEGL